ncbi:hypothetical protein P9Z80_30210 [Bacillus cereus]|nr:hypothetical protein [Bacillus cereus]MEC3259312.1 hypothetical protein [Bacillus cereus]
MRIALCGEARSGKDTVGECLEGFHRLAFGHYMKEAYFKKFPEKRYLPKDREDMIAFSQPKEERDPLIWVRPLDRDMRIWHSGGVDNFVITDLRQPHEEKWCRDNSFHIVRVHSNEIIRHERMRKHGERPQKDLTYWVAADFHIYNGGSLEDLQSQVDNLLDCLNEQEMKRRRL